MSKFTSAINTINESYKTELVTYDYGEPQYVNLDVHVMDVHEHFNHNAASKMAGITLRDIADHWDSIKDDLDEGDSDSIGYHIKRISEGGDLGALVVNGDDGYLDDGYHRLLAMQIAGVTKHYYYNTTEGIDPNVVFYKIK